jgi:hypothetical protein|tara:strand:- start:89 stop:454 length:366 start_codon:yes stop_codon:yes gene_type:complete
MPVVEYKLHVVGNRGQRRAPDFIREGGNLPSTDHSVVGWVVANPEYWIPDTIVTLTKADLVARQLALHAATPERKYTGSETDQSLMEADTDNWRDKTNAEVTSETETWYDDYAARCASITK